MVDQLAQLDAPEAATSAQQPDPLAGAYDQVRAEAEGRHVTMPLPWIRLSILTRMLHPGTVAVIGGPLGQGKSYLALQILKTVAEAGYRCSYLPLEESRDHHVRRLAAVVDGSFTAVEPGDRARRVLDRHRAVLERLAPCIKQNPFQPERRGHRIVLFRPGWKDVLTWVRHRLTTDRVVVVDPLAQIEFGSWQRQSDFVQEAVAMAAESGNNLILVAHTIKSANPDRLRVADLQGSADLVRLVQSILLLQAHDFRKGIIWRRGGEHDQVIYNRTVMIAKARHGRGADQSVAFTFGPQSPRFEEQGVLDLDDDEIEPDGREGEDALSEGTPQQDCQAAQPASPVVDTAASSAQAEPAASGTFA